MTTVTIQDLNSAYLEVANNGPVDRFIKQFRDDPQVKNLIKRSDVKNLFKQMTLWTKTKQSSGHITYKHKVTTIVIGFQGHVSGKKKLSTIPADQAQTICDELQRHVNILGNNVFGYVNANWKTVPNFPESLARYHRQVQNNTLHNV